MGFGEKLFQLRKAEGMSQETLAEKLNTSRQAISKWENNQGFPETEKLLMLGNIFNVSMDYLLKDTVEIASHKENGYYVSKEMAEGFLIHERKIAKYGVIGICLVISSFIPYLLLKQYQVMMILMIAALVTVGIGCLVAVSFMEDEYKILKIEPLIFDETYLKELKKRYSMLRGKYITFIVIGIGFLVLGGVVLLLFEKGYDYLGDNSLIYAGCTFSIGLGVFILGYFASMLEAYELLVKNDEYINTLSQKLLRKFRQKKDLL